MKKLTKKQFELCYVENLKATLRYAASILHDSHRAEDVVQEAFLRLSKASRESVKGEVNAWLFTVVRNLCLHTLNKERRYFYVESQGTERYNTFNKAGKADDNLSEFVLGCLRRLDMFPSAADICCDSEEIKNGVTMTNSLIATLPKNTQKVVRLRFFKNLSYSEIAKRINSTASAVGFTLNIAKAKMLNAYNKMVISNKLERVKNERKATHKDGSTRGISARVDDYIQSSKQRRSGSQGLRQAGLRRPRSQPSS